MIIGFYQRWNKAINSGFPYRNISAHGRRGYWFSYHKSIDSRAVSKSGISLKEKLNIIRTTYGK